MLTGVTAYRQLTVDPKKVETRKEGFSFTRDCDTAKLIKGISEILLQLPFIEILLPLKGC
jgi:hypothetical protein